MSRSAPAVLVAALLALAACGGGDAEAGDPDPDRVGPQGRVAQFVVHCGLSHVAFDDPIVLPDRPGASHQHQFFGNTAIDSDPDYDRVSGAPTSCEQQGDTASYWSPTLLDAAGRRIDPVAFTAYYRPGDGVDPTEVVAYPPSFMMVGGDARADEPQSESVVAWSCGSGARRDPSPPECNPDSTLRALVTFPDCWDGELLTSFGSGEHVRYSDGGCPDSHPVPVPQLTIAIDYPPVDPEGLSLSSGSTDTMHADFWNVWDQAKLEEEVALCLHRDLVCGLG